MSIEAFKQAHANSDVDQGRNSLHHTLGTGPNQALSGAVFKEFKASLFDLIYPVGSIYMSTDSSNPSALFGGTWVAWGSGRVPVGVDSSDTSFDVPDKTGGEKNHTLSVDEMPSHNHPSSDAHQIKTGGYGLTVTAAHANTVLRRGTPGSSSSDNPFFNTANVGGGQAHNNLQPYITCYMWKRES